MDHTFHATVQNVPIDIDLQAGTLSFFGLPSALFWLNPSLYRMLAPLIQESGRELAQLLIAYESSQGTKEDYEFMVEKLGPTFEEGFLAWGRAVGVAGWGSFELPIFDKASGRALVRIHNAWELRAQSQMPYQWGCPFLKGKIIGIFCHALGQSCWAEERVLEGQPHTVEFLLSASSSTISGEIERLRNQAAAQKQAELLTLEQQLIEKQRTILQLAMPVVRLWDGILLLPLIGEIDTHRAALLMDSALAAITKHAARVVIIDITGVPLVDSHVANSLIKTVQASKLLGVDCMLVGISAEVARSLVLLGIDLGFVQTFSTLETGLTEALAKQNYEIVSRSRTGNPAARTPNKKR